MTLNQIIEDVAPHRRVSPAQMRRYLTKLKIRPLGQIQTCPAEYPGDSGKRVKTLLGFTDSSAPAGTADDHGSTHENGNGRVVSLKKLKSARATAARK